MSSTRVKIIFVFLLAFGLSGCLAERHAIMYSDMVEKSSGSFKYGKDPVGNGQIESAGLTLSLRMPNSYEENASLWFGIEIPMVPLYITWKDKPYTWTKGEFFNVIMVLMPHKEGYRFVPHKVLMTVDGQNYNPEGFKERCSGDLNRMAQKPCEIALEFAMQPPSPKQDIVLVFSEAISGPGGENVPPIHFKKSKYTRWIA